VQPAYAQELARYHTPILNMTGAVEAYLRVSSSDYVERHFHAYVELLMAPQLIQTRNYGDDAYVIISPSAQPRMYDIRHAYLHFQIDPVMIRYGVDLQQKRSLLDLVQTAPMDDNYKTDFVLLANESLIKAVEGRLDKDTGAIDRATRQGFIMAPFFAEQLPTFENQQQGLRFYADVMINAIDLKAEAARLSTVKFDSAQLQRVAKQVVVAGQELSAAGKTLEKAENLYAERRASPENLDAAKTLFSKALEQKGDPAEHAQAWYGLARISVLENRGAIAIQLFQKTLESSPDDFTRGWTNYYLGGLYKSSHDLTLATKYYQDALAVNGASDKAKQAAAGELRNISKNQEKQTP
jgi:tetratricopeptide (TPR) repeat protein